MSQRKIKIRAPLWRCYEIAADVERMPEWHRSLVGVEVLRRDFKGRPDVVDLVADVTVPLIANLRFTYEPPNGLGWEGQIRLPQSDSRARGRWAFEDLGDGRTGAILTYEFEPRPKDLRRGMVLGIFVGGWADGLKERAAPRRKPDPAAWARMSDEELAERQREEQSRLVESE
jgi:hypothetical protein